MIDHFLSLSRLPAWLRAAALAAVLLAVGACSVTPPLSGRAPPPPSTAPPAPPVVDIVPAPPVPPPPFAVTPPPTPPPTTGAAVARPTGTGIALILPLESPAYGRAASAVKAGFLAAAARAGASARVQVIAHGDDGVLPAFAAAAQSGVAVAVGPLTRDDLKTVLAMSPLRPRMLALNQTDEGAPLPAGVYASTLSLEQDAAVLMRVARGDGVKAIAVVGSDSPFQRRFSQSFVAAWRREGGAPPREYRFDASPEQLGALRRELTTQPIDAVLLAVDASDAALAKSFLRGRVYASSQITDGLPAQMLYDLENVRYIEVPWLAEPDNPAFAGVPRADYDDPVLERLYALGIDAFALAQMLAEPTPPDRIELDGATGHLSLLPSRVFAREGRVMTIHDGRVLAESPAR
ncbi:MAG TPA: penicillin-binding protein activator [Casimicrobiaceae bacterium]|nr:penicillin-binding protein activator [Casimicrobiaceae bacterium]